MITKRAAVIFMRSVYNCFRDHISALYAQLYPENQIAAFSSYRLFESLGFVLAIGLWYNDGLATSGISFFIIAVVSISKLYIKN